MEELISWARAVGVKRIELSVVEGNDRAIRLYEKFGFSLEGVKRKAVLLEDGYRNVLIMAKLLD